MERWPGYYEELAAAFELTIDVIGPVFGNEALLAEIADSPEMATLVGERSRYLWPDDYDLRSIPIRDPTPVYPMSLIWRHDNAHPAVAISASTFEPRSTTTATLKPGPRKWASHRYPVARGPAKSPRATSHSAPHSAPNPGLQRVGDTYPHTNRRLVVRGSLIKLVAVTAAHAMPPWPSRFPERRQTDSTGTA
ncbi:MAG: hypothetical protein QOK11_3313 [Pseudonocardiales bacterium]|nr:hypothetical protein [Pseudonocardiales bacterium]